MIGHLVAAYCRGREDAAAGRRPRSCYGRERYAHQIYRTGHSDERKRMAETGRLPQLELDLDTPREGAQAPGG
jgi:hypothetical protein